MAIKKRIRMKKNIKWLFLYILLLSVAGFSLLKIFVWGEDNIENNVVKNDIIEDVKIEIKDDQEETYIETDLNKLKEKNSDTVAWIQVPNTNINYPVLQTTDNEYYLTKNFYQQVNEAGWIFLDYRNKLDGTDKNTIIYGHNRLDGSMFGTLKKALNQIWLKSNKYIYFNTIDTSNTYRIFSAYSINAQDFNNSTSFFTTQSYQDYLDDIKNKSIVDLDVDVTVDDQIITLYTCANNNIDRTIVHAKLIQSIKTS